MARFLHIADVLVGMHATDAHRVAATLRESRFQALLRAVDVARQRNVDFIVSAGDLFEDNLVGSVEVQRVVQALDGAGMPVYLLPGNHDALTANSVYRRPAFALAANVHVLAEPVPVPIPGADCTLYPCPLTQRTTLEDPTGWIPLRAEGDGIRIAVAHGDLVGFGQDIATALISTTVANDRGLDYVALGHWHSRHLRKAQRCAYSGTPEQTRFGERDSGYVLLVDIPSAEAPPTISSERVGQLRWEELERELQPDDATWDQLLKESVEGLGDDGPNTLVRIDLTGAIPSEHLPKVAELETWLEARVQNEDLLHYELRDSLRTAEELGQRLEGAIEQEPVLAAVVAELRLLESGGAADVTGLEAEPRPLMELLRVWQGTGLSETVDTDVAARRALQLLQQIIGEDG